MLLIKMKLVWVIIASNVRPHVFQILTTCHYVHQLLSVVPVTQVWCLTIPKQQVRSAFLPIVHKQEVYSLQ